MNKRQSLLPFRSLSFEQKRQKLINIIKQIKTNIRPMQKTFVLIYFLLDTNYPITEDFMDGIYESLLGKTK